MRLKYVKIGIWNLEFVFWNFSSCPQLELVKEIDAHSLFILYADYFLELLPDLFSCAFFTYVNELTVSICITN